MSPALSRRDLLRLAGAAAAVPVLSSCAGAPTAQNTAAPGTFTVRRTPTRAPGWSDSTSTIAE